MFVDEAGRPLFLPFMEEYLRGVQSKLSEWTTRSVDQVCALSPT